MLQSARALLAIFWIAALIGLSSASPAWARDCALRVVVEGDEPARTNLADALARSGTGSAPDPGCTVETVHVSARDRGLALTITDPYGRVTQRKVDDLETAVAVVEATPGSDALLPLLPEADSPDALGDVPMDAQPRSLAEPKAPAALVSQNRAAPPMPERGVSLAVATELVTGFDGSSWAGVAVSGCVMLGPTCIGTTVRFWDDLEADEESGNAIHLRTTGEVAVSLEVPIARQRLTVRPGVELGLGWVHMGQFAVSPRPSDGDADFDQGEVVAGGHITASYRIAPRWAVEGGVGATLSLFARHTAFVSQGIQLPGTPLAFGIVSLGLRYGGP